MHGGRGHDLCTGLFTYNVYTGVEIVHKKWGGGGGGGAQILVFVVSGGVGGRSLLAHASSGCARSANTSSGKPKIKNGGALPPLPP